MFISHLQPATVIFERLSLFKVLQISLMWTKNNWIRVELIICWLASQAAKIRYGIGTH